MPEIEVDVIEDDVLFEVIKNFGQLQDSALQYSKCRIVQTDNYHDRPQENISPYTPEIISIGALHHGKPELQPMENIKHKLLNDLLNRRSEYDLIPSPSSDGRNDELLRRFIKAARDMEERARSGYELSNTISSNDFVKMLVVDGCFLLEFLIKNSLFITWEDLGWRLPLIKFDILLFENQIPFFVLQEFLKILMEFYSDDTDADTDTEADTDTDTHKIPIEIDTMTKIAYDYLYIEKMIFFDNKWHKISSTILTDSEFDTSNLLHLCHRIIFNEKSICGTGISFADLHYSTMPTSAMDLEEAGVRFQGSVMDLKFENRTFFIPVLSLDDKKLRLLKNLLAFEFYYQEMVYPGVHIYAALLFHLIKKPEDLKVMEKHQIITRTSRGEESFRLVSDFIESGFGNYEFLEYTVGPLGWWNLVKIKAALMAYCEKPHHRWLAKLMKDYFGNPWSILGIFVGALLLVLTALQTVFTVLSYYN